MVSSSLDRWIRLTVAQMTGAVGCSLEAPFFDQDIMALFSRGGLVETPTMGCTCLSDKFVNACVPCLDYS